MLTFQNNFLTLKAQFYHILTLKAQFKHILTLKN